VLISFTVTQGGDYGFLVSVISPGSKGFLVFNDPLRLLEEWLLSMAGSITKRGTPTFQCMSFSLITHATHRLSSAETPSWKSPLSFLEFWLTPWTPEEKAGIERTEWFHTKGSGYISVQSTEPQTLGYGLADSPVGLLAWIYGKLALWTDGYKWSDDEGISTVTEVFGLLLTCFDIVLTWISLYWFSRAGPAASLRIYFEMAGECSNLGHGPTIPMGTSYFPKELIVVPATCVSSDHHYHHEANMRA